jgi:adenosine deaminase CECR1
MKILDDGVKATLAEIKQQGDYFADMKVIYCTPRSFDKGATSKSLNECIELKKKFSHLICGKLESCSAYWLVLITVGFDLVGHEEMGHELKTFIPEFLDFRKKCNEQNLDIPFLFHCGETLQVGDTVDGNLFDAILLNSKRIGHGYAIARHPLLMKMFKEKNIAIESCPISNEILGLTPVMAGHHLPILLANDVPCTINSDNATFYK